MKRTVLREALVLVAFFALSVAMTWPLARNMRTAVAYPGDPYIMAWALDWDVYALRAGRDPFDAPMFHPAKNTLAFTENVFGVAIFAAPFLLAGVHPIVVLNLMMVAGFAFTGYAACVLGRVVTGRAWPGVIAGIAFTFTPWRFTHLPHMQFTWSPWFVLLPAVLLWYARRPGWKRAALVGGVFLMNGLTNLHWLAIGSACVVLLSLLFLFDRSLRADLKFWIRLVTAGAVATILLLPMLLPYRELQKTYGMRGNVGETTHYSGRLGDWRWASPASKVHPDSMKSSTVDPERWLFVGFLPFALMGLGVAAGGFPRENWRRGLRVAAVAGFAVIAASAAWGKPLPFEGRETTATWVIVAAMIALGISADAEKRAAVAAGSLLVALGMTAAFGLHAPVHRFFFEHVALFKGIRAPVRWAGAVHVALAMFAALGAGVLIPRRRWLAHGAGVILSIALLLELRAAPIRWALEWEPPPVYSWLASQQLTGAIAELPMDYSGSDFHYVRGLIEHRKPIVNGASGFAPPVYDEIRSLFLAQPIPDALLDRLETIGTEIVIVHTDRTGGHEQHVRDWVGRELGRGRLVLLRRFENGVKGDFVFATRKAAPAVLAGASNERDGAGMTPHDALESWMSGGYLYNDRPVAYVEHPLVWGGVEGPLEVRGWATSPAGIKRIDVYLENGTVRREAAIGPAPDIDAVFPWFGGTARRYQLTLDVHPRGVDKDTDVYVEVTDERGRKGRSPHFWFTWHK